MGRFIRPTLTLVLALFMREGPTTGPATTTGPGAASMPAEPSGDEDWYEPRAEDFQPSYDRDLANGGKQTWEQYWGWVKLFYQGNFLTKGWNDRARWLVEGVRSGREQERLRSGLNALGRDICAEWSKDYDVRKVGSADLMTWGKMLEKARTGDDGTGAGLRRALEEIRAAHRRKLGGSSSSLR